MNVEHDDSDLQVPEENSSSESVKPEPEIGNIPLAVGAGVLVAILGALLWGSVSGLLNTEAGIIALAIGLGVGYSVISIAKLPSNQLAITASLLAIGGILLGKIFAFYMVAPETIKDQWEKDPDTQTEFIARYLYVNELLTSDEKNVYEKIVIRQEGPSEKDREFANAILMKAENMTSSEKEKALDFMVKKAVSSTSFTDMIKPQLRPIDILWVILAVASAWRICSEGRRG